MKVNGKTITSTALEFMTGLTADVMKVIGTQI